MKSIDFQQNEYFFTHSFYILSEIFFIWKLVLNRNSKTTFLWPFLQIQNAIGSINIGSGSFLLSAFQYEGWIVRECSFYNILIIMMNDILDKTKINHHHVYRTYLHENINVSQEKGICYYLYLCSSRIVFCLHHVQNNMPIIT